MARRSDNDSAKEGPLELAGLILLTAVIMITLVWLAASNKIVYFWTPALKSVGSLWEFGPGEWSAGIAASIYRDARVFMAKPADVGFFEFAGFVNRAIAPATIGATLLGLAWLVRVLMLPKADVFRRFKSADDLLRRMSFIFTGTAPILHIRQDIAKHKDPLWARQRFPEEVLLGERVAAGELVTGDRSAPERMRAHRDRIETWFKGLEGASTKGSASLGGGRQFSTMLGNQMVNLASIADRRMFKAVPTGDQAAFPDRFSDVGKVMFGMLCAHAFGGADGVKDTHLARDQLNNSCRGAKHGLPNLKVAQWIFDKYRCNELAHKLFAVHHWEYTYLFELYIQAKRRGKITDGEFRWLKPASRIMWYALNTVGRFTPHTDSATVFNMHAFERKASRRGRWPLRLNGSGVLQHTIYVEGAVDGLLQAWENWRNGTDENDDEWWKDKAAWITPEKAVMTSMSAPPVPGDTEAARQLGATSFDSAQSKARAESADAAKKSEADALAGLLSD